MSDIKQRVIFQIARFTNRDPAEISPQTTFEELGIASMDALTLAFDIEEEFGITIPDQAVYGLRSVEDVISGVQSHLNASNP